MKKLLLIAAAALTLGTAQAESDPHAEAIATIEARLAGFPIESISPSPIPGLYEVIAAGQVVYFTGDMKYAVDGSIIDHDAKINLTDRTLNQIRSRALNELKEGDYLAFKPKGDPKYTINVFTDVDCAFCRKLHQEVPELNEKGVEVRYFLYPRAGLESASARKLESIWCAGDRQTAMTRAKSGQSVESKRCSNPMEQHAVLAGQMGLTGTPLIITSGGTRINGYRPADQIYTTLLGEAVNNVKKSAAN